MFDSEALTAKLGPLPAWGWGVGIGVGYLGVRWYRRRQADASGATDTTTTDPTTMQDSGFSASGPGGYYDPSLVNGQGVGFDPSTGVYTPGAGSNCPPGWIELDGVCQPLSTITGGQGAPGAPGARGPQGARGCDAGYHYDAKKKKCVRTPASHRCRKGYHWDTHRKKCVRSHSLSSSSSRDSLARNAATPGARATGAAPAGPAPSSHPLAAPTRVPVRGPQTGLAGQNRYQHASSGVHPA